MLFILLFIVQITKNSSYIMDYVDRVIEVVNEKKWKIKFLRKLSISAQILVKVVHEVIFNWCDSNQELIIVFLKLGEKFDYLHISD